MSKKINNSKFAGNFARNFNEDVGKIREGAGNAFGAFPRITVSEKYKNPSNLFAMAVLVIGITNLIVSWNLDNDIRKFEATNCNACKSEELKTSNKILLCLSIFMITSSLYFLVAGCSKWFFDYYLTGMIVIGIILVVLGSIISQKIKETGCQVLAPDWLITTLGSFAISIPILSKLYEWFTRGLGGVEAKSEPVSGGGL
jgi:hypothetical protein